MSLAPKRADGKLSYCGPRWGNLLEEHVLPNGDVEATYICDARVHQFTQTFKGLGKTAKLSLSDDNAYQPTDLEDY